MRSKMATWWVAAMLLTLAAAPALAAGRGWLGVTTQSTDADLRRGLDLTRDGLLVNQVSEDSPADRAGLRKGDVILTFNSRTVTTPEELRSLVRDTEPGHEVSLGIWRDGSRRTLQLRVGELPNSDDESGDEDMTPTPEAPRAPRAPEAPPAPGDDDHGSVHRRVFIDGHEVPQDQIDDKLKDLPRVNDGTLDLRGLRNLRDWSNPDGMRMLMPEMPGRGRLGVRVEKLNEDLGQALGVDGDKGVLVVEVLEDTPAQKAGLRAGDVIMSVDGDRVESPDDLVKTLADKDGKVDITVQRKGVRRDVQAELEARSSRGTTMYWNEDRTPSRNREPGTGTRGYRTKTKDDTTDDSDLREQIRQLKQELKDLRDQMKEDKK